MASIQTLQKDDFGTVFSLTYRDQDGDLVDISGATTQQIIFKKPSAATVTKSTTFVTDGADGRAEYTLETGVLDEAGTWEVQGKVALVAGTWSSDVQEFKVEDNLA